MDKQMVSTLNFCKILMINCVKIQNIHQEPKQTFDDLKHNPWETHDVT